MNPERSIEDQRNRRVPKQGFIITLIRIVGAALVAVGILITVVSTIGFIIVLVKMVPNLVAAISYPESMLSGFVIMGFVVWLVAIMAVGILGGIMSVFGFGLRWLASNAMKSKQIIGKDFDASSEVEDETTGMDID
jgi:hypothetical protein